MPTSPYLPRMTNTDPWDITSTLAAELAKQAMYEQKAANDLAVTPIEHGMLLDRLRQTRQLQLDTLPQELDIRDRAAIPSEQRAEEREARGLVRRTDQDIRRYKDTNTFDLQMWKDNPDYFETRGRGITPGKAVEPDPGWENVAPAGDIDRMTGRYTPPTFSPDIEVDTKPKIGRDGKVYFNIRRRQAQPVDPNTPIPPGRGDNPTGKPPTEIPALPEPPARKPIPQVYPGVNPSAVTRPPKEVEPVTPAPPPESRVPRSMSEAYPGINPNAVAPQGPAWVDPPRRPEPEWTEPPARPSAQAEPIRSRGLGYDIHDSLIKAGLSDQGARMYLGEVGRENGFNPDLIFGAHSDPYNGKSNMGLISWQGDRRAALLRYLANEGLLDESGRPLVRKATLDAMARFSVDEMRQRNPLVHSILTADQVDPRRAKAGLAAYIGWRANDPAYAHHHGIRDRWIERANQRLSSRPDVRATIDPDIFEVLTS